MIICIFHIIRSYSLEIQCSRVGRYHIKKNVLKIINYHFLGENIVQFVLRTITVNEVEWARTLYLLQDI